MQGGFYIKEHRALLVKTLPLPVMRFTDRLAVHINPSTLIKHIEVATSFLDPTILIADADLITKDSFTQSNQQFVPGDIWRDTAGQPINAHGGGVLFHAGVYYWYGEIKEGRTYLPKVNESWGGTRVPAASRAIPPRTFTTGRTRELCFRPQWINPTMIWLVKM